MPRKPCVRSRNGWIGLARVSSNPRDGAWRHRRQKQGATHPVPRPTPRLPARVRAILPLAFPDAHPRCESACPGRTRSEGRLLPHRQCRRRVHCGRAWCEATDERQGPQSRIVPSVPVVASVFPVRREGQITHAALLRFDGCNGRKRYRVVEMDNARPVTCRNVFPVMGIANRLHSVGCQIDLETVQMDKLRQVVPFETTVILLSP